VLRADHRVLDEDARARRADWDAGVRERAAALERDDWIEDRMLGG
jgi:hypothetical protein